MATTQNPPKLSSTDKDSSSTSADKKVTHTIMKLDKKNNSVASEKITYNFDDKGNHSIADYTKLSTEKGSSTGSSLKEIKN